MDPYQQAQALFPVLDDLMSRITALGTRLSSLQTSKPHFAPEFPDASQAAARQHKVEIDQTAAELAGLKDQLRNTIHRLGALAGELDKRSQDYRGAADQYRRGAAASFVDESKRQMSAGAGVGYQSAEESYRQAEEIRYRIRQARKVLEAGPEPTFATASIDDVVKDAMNESYPKSPPYSGAASYWPAGAYGTRTYSTYTPGNYTLSMPYESGPSYVHYTGGMKWPF